MSGCPTRTGPQAWASDVPSARTVTADAQGRFRVEAFVPGVETEVTIAVPNRGGVQLDGGNALRKPALKPGELRDLGDVKAKEIHQQ